MKATVARSPPNGSLKGRSRSGSCLRRAPIASGAVEGACKNLIRDRFERSGMRWTPPMAEAMLRLRAVYLSAQFDEYWEFHVQQEQQRLHSKRPWRVVRK